MIGLYFTALIISSIFYLVIQKYFIKNNVYDKIIGVHYMMLELQEVEEVLYL